MAAPVPTLGLTDGVEVATGVVDGVDVDPDGPPRVGSTCTSRDWRSTTVRSGRCPSKTPTDQAQGPRKAQRDAAVASTSTAESGRSGAQPQDVFGRGTPVVPFGRQRDADLMETIAVHHVSINVSDVDEALRFYVEVLGLSPRDDRPELGIGGAWLDAGGQQVHLIGGTTPPNVGQHFALLVADIDASVAELRGRGISVTDPFAIGTGRQAFLEDPAGNVIELHQTGAG